MARFQQYFKEESYLEQRRAELSALRTRHAQARADLRQLRDEISRFEMEYERTLGRRLTELEEVEAEIARLNGCTTEEGHWQDAFFEAADVVKEGAWRSEPEDIKSLYREVAKAVHPDLAGAGPGLPFRNELMSKANRAYAANDLGALHEILRNWRHVQGSEAWDADRSRVSLVMQEIAREQQELRALNGTLEGLRNGYACRLKLRAEASRRLGGDLFAEMATAVEGNLARARGRLAALKSAAARAACRESKPTRKLLFPEEVSCGTLFVRELGSVDYSRWKELGAARGGVEIAVDQAVRLDVKGGHAGLVGFLQRLRPNDLQSLYLYEACDADLDRVLWLTGLEELYLSGAQLTDAALSSISSLTGLKRIYIYQTGISDRGLVHLQTLPSLRGLTLSGNSITEEGLACFQRAIPRVKTVSFQWKR